MDTRAPARTRNQAADSQPKSGDSVTLQMTPMIDIVFQLLVFFVMTFQVASQEGEFLLKLPALGFGGTDAQADAQLPMIVELRANSDGDIASVAVNDRELDAPWQAQLRGEVIRVVGSQPDLDSYHEQREVVLKAAPGLKYQHTMDAITAVSGYRDPNGNLVRLTERVSLDRLAD